MTDQQLNEQREQIATLLKYRRNYLQLTQEQVAEMSGLGIATIKRLEGAKFWIGTKQLVQWCAALEINLADLMRRQLNNLGDNENAELPQDRSQRI